MLGFPVVTSANYLIFTRFFLLIAIGFCLDQWETASRPKLHAQLRLPLFAGSKSPRRASVGRSASILHF